MTDTSTSDTDVLVDEALATPPEGGTLPDGRKVYVCHWPARNGEGICGATFEDPPEGRKDAKPRWNSHCQAVHQTTWDGKPTARTGNKPKNADQAPKTPPASKAEKDAVKKAVAHPGSTLTDSNRAATYAQSLATVGILGHLAAGRYFDDYDLDVWTRGTPALANGLEAVGEQNPGLRRACDLLLAGGSGGAYVQLIMAATMIAVPIAAHHGFLPPATGERFGAMIGAMAPSPPEGQAPAPSPGSPVVPVAPTGTIPLDQWTMDEWREVLFGAATNTDAQQVMMEMMSMAEGPTVVSVPDMPGMTPMDIPQEEHRGSVGTDNGRDASEPVEPIPAP